MNFKKIAAILLVLVIAMTGIFAQSISEVYHGEYEGKTVILHSNDTHGSLAGFAKMATMRKYFEHEGAAVIVTDAGDFTQGSPYVSFSKGASAIEMMNQVPYNFVGLGNHDFDFGVEQLKQNLSNAKFYALCANIFDKNGDSLLPPYVVLTLPGGAKVGIMAIDTPETQTKVNPIYVKDLIFPVGQDLIYLAQQVVDYMRQTEGCDTIICIAHLGIDKESEPYTSENLLKYVSGIDFVIDGHSHSVFSGYNGLPMQQTGIYFQNIGVIVIDNATGKIVDNFLKSCEEIEDDPEVLAVANDIIGYVDSVYGIKFAESTVSLNGVKSPGNRDMETNNGDLITEAMLWVVTKNPDAIKVPAEDVVAVTNGGGIRAPIVPGDVTMKDINSILPFGNNVTVVYIKGSELLMALEASTQSLPGPLGAFPQICGMHITIDTTKAYDKADETYPESTYYGPKSINRVTIDDINGKPFDPEKTYAVVTNDFCSAGGDTYYIFKNASDEFNTGMPLDEVMMAYITEVLNGVIGEKYAEAQGRITIIK